MNQPFNFLDTSNLSQEVVDSLKAILDPSSPSQIELPWDASSNWSISHNSEGNDGAKADAIIYNVPTAVSTVPISYTSLAPTYHTGSEVLGSKEAFTYGIAPLSLAPPAGHPLIVRYISPSPAYSPAIPGFMEASHPHSSGHEMEHVPPLAATSVYHAPPIPAGPPPFPHNVDASPFTMNSSIYPMPPQVPNSTCIVSDKRSAPAEVPSSYNADSAPEMNGYSNKEECESSLKTIESAPSKIVHEESNKQDAILEETSPQNNFDSGDHNNEESIVPNSHMISQNLSNVKLEETKENESKSNTSTSISLPKLSYAAVAGKGSKPSTNPPQTNLSPKDNLEPLGNKDHQQNGEYHSYKVAEDNLAPKLAKIFESLQIDPNTPTLLPRGLINRKNWCYINATLQAFLACSPLYNLLKSVSSLPAVNNRKSSTPILDGLIKFVNEFNLPLGNGKPTADGEDPLQNPSPFEPLDIYKMLGVIKSKCVMGQQEDAEEFLTCILDGLNEEIVAIMKYPDKGSNYKTIGEAPFSNGHVIEDDNWQVVSNKKKGSANNFKLHGGSSSPITDIFQGQLKKVLSCGTNTSITIEPFYTLRLDIQGDNVSHLEEALLRLTSKEIVHGYVCPRTHQQLEVFQHYSIHRLPFVLILCFKRFVYHPDGGGCKKVLKKVSFPVKLELNKEYLSTEKKMKHPEMYSLFSVVYHDGEEAGKGHYIADVLHPRAGGWLRCNDRTLTPISELDVLQFSPPRVPYLLFYHRSTTLR